jgi:hypothetical protein
MRLLNKEDEKQLRAIHPLIDKIRRFYLENGEQEN